MADLQCDVAVIGAGTAGISAERSARKAGARTLLIDPEFSGTTCATVGCMPSKLLIAAGKVAHSARESDRFGIRTGPVEIDGAGVLERLRRHRDSFAASARKNFDRLPDGTCQRNRARFLSADTLELDDGRTVGARSIVIATGSSPSVPPPFRELGDRLVTNETIFELDDLPRSLAVIGGGVIGLELAQAMARLEVKVALFDRLERMAQVRCDTVHAHLQDAMQRDFDLYLDVDPRPEATRDGVVIRWGAEERLFDKVLVATGRPPNLKDLDLAATGLALDDKGMPDVDTGTMQCGNAPIFMAGDANGLRPVLHEANDEGHIAGRNAASWPELSPSRRAVPFTVTFTDPPLVSIGDIPESGVMTGGADYARQSRARIEGTANGFVRLYGARDNGRLLGADMFCPGADHLGHLVAWAIEAKLTAGEILDLPFYHPTLEEGLRGALHEIAKAAG